MRLTSLSNMNKETEDKIQDLQKCAAKRKKYRIFVKISLPFNTQMKLVGPALPSGWSSKWEKQVPSWMSVLRDLLKMAIKIPFLVELFIPYLPLLSPVHISTLTMSSGGSLFMTEFVPSNYTYVAPHILLLRCWMTPWRNQKWLPFFCPTSLIHNAIKLHEVLFEEKELKLISKPQEKEVYFLWTT